MRTEETDEALVAASLRGDREAFARIVERHQGLVCAVTYSVLGDLAASEDVAQEAFLAAWRSLASLRVPSRLRPWLAGIARNLARAAARQRRADVAAGAASLDDAGPMVAAELPPADLAARGEEQALLWSALARVPERYRHVLVLYYREHQSVREVAGALGLNEDAVKQRLARGREALKSEWEGQLMASMRRPITATAFTASVLAGLNLTAGKAAAGTTALASTGTAAVTGATMGVIGGVLGSAIGVAGAAFGVACSIRAARSPRERAYLVKMAWITSVGTALEVGLYLVVAFAYRELFSNAWFQVAFWSIHALVLTVGIVAGNRRLARIQAEEAAQRDRETGEDSA